MTIEIRTESKHFALITCGACECEKELMPIADGDHPLPSEWDLAKNVADDLGWFTFGRPKPFAERAVTGLHLCPECLARVRGTAV